MFPSPTGGSSSNCSNSRNITQSFREQKQLESFIRRSNLLKLVVSAAETHINRYRDSNRRENWLAAVHVYLPFDYAEFLQAPVELLQLPVGEPHQFAKTARYSVFSIVRDHIKQSGSELDSLKLEFDQVHVRLSWSGLPIQQGLFFAPSQGRCRCGLSVVGGILSALSEPEHLVLQSVWYCASGCLRNKIRAEASTEAPVCTGCSRPMSEYTKLRSTEETHLLRLLPCEAAQTPTNTNKVFRAIVVRVEGTGVRGMEHRSTVIEKSVNADADVSARSGFMAGSQRQTSPQPVTVPWSELTGLQTDGLEAHTCSLMSFNCESWLPQTPGLAEAQKNQHDEQDSVITVHVQRDSRSDEMSLSFDNSLANAHNDSWFMEMALPGSTTYVETKQAPQEGGDWTVTGYAQPRVDDDCDDIMKWLPEDIKQEYLDLSSLPCTPQVEQVDPTFDQQFMFYEDCEVKLSTENQFTPLELDFALLEALEREHTQPCIEQVTRTQIVVPPHRSPCVAEEISKSCPRHTVVAGDIAHNDPLDFLKDDVSAACGAKNSSERGGEPSAVDPTLIPTSVRQLYDIIRTKYSDFAFVYALSAQLCQERVPMDCWVQVKLGLLLSLASIGPNSDCAPIPIVVFCGDGYMAHNLLSQIGQLSARYIVAPPEETRPLAGRIGARRQSRWFEADPILLGKGGVCYLGDWSRLKRTRADSIFKIVECSRVLAELSVASDNTTKAVVCCPLQTAIWTHWRSVKNNVRDQQCFNKFVKIFGILLFMDGDNHDVLASFVVDQSLARAFESTVDHLSISSEDMRSFLAVISHRTVDMMPEAAILLQRYFVASRIERPDCLTKQAFVMLKQFAESFAKLALRHEVLTIDAVSAVYMCEHFIQRVFGTSTRVCAPPPFESHNFIGLVDEYMTRFKDWLLAYIDKYYEQQ